MLYFLAIESARESIHIQNAYFVPTRQIREALIRAARRGVDVRIMVPGLRDRGFLLTSLSDLLN